MEGLSADAVRELFFPDGRIGAWARYLDQPDAPGTEGALERLLGNGFFRSEVFGRSELLVAPAMPPAAPAIAGCGGAQFLNMTYCWPSVHTLVVTQ